MKRSAELVECDYTAKEFIVRAEASDTSTEGAELISGPIFQAIVEAKKYFGGLENNCEVINTSQAYEIKFVPVDNTARTGTESTQNQTVSDVDVVFETPVNLNAYSTKSAI